ncbi:MAG TPA: LytTR family DNA-binding domain-containing protein [Soehngenia sp.]|mgnify:CR=1 FL=1|nr:LytTR family DNA-binding domain-containing protein [Soehngenia sp.]
MINVLIADDEIHAREEVKYLLHKYRDFTVIGQANHGMEVLKLNHSLKPDVIFLDIKMPTLDGIEVAKIINDLKDKPELIFLTAYDDYAVNSYEFDVIDYLLKPISEERFEKSIQKLRAKFADNIISPKESEIKNDKTKGVISSYKNGLIIPIRYTEILYATIYERETLLVTKDDEYKVNLTLGQLYQLLKDHDFFRTHKSYIVNLDYIKSIEPWFNSTYNVLIEYRNIKIPVSRNYVKEFRERMNIN